jgi:hypothetical protein
MMGSYSIMEAKNYESIVSKCIVKMLHIMIKALFNEKKIKCFTIL